MKHKYMVLLDESSNFKLLHVECKNEELDLKQAVHDATLEYCKSREGSRVFMDKGGFSYEDFLNLVPDEICAEFGIRKGSVITPGLVAAQAEQILGASDIAALAKDEVGFSESNRTVCEIAVRFALMWGIIQTLEGRELLAVNSKNSRTGGGMGLAAGMMMSWAEEFVKSDSSDLTAFFQGKLENLERKRLTIKSQV